MSDLNTLKLYLEEELKTLDLPENPTNLYEPIRYILTLGGKRIRPVLVLMACDLFAGDYKKAISAAKAIELFHNFSLMHDDIMDDAPLRRGKTTVHEKWNEHVAILSGDAMLICAYKELLKSEGNTTSLFEIFNNVALEVCEGQMLDMNFETRFDVHVDEYLHMISQKTAILLSGALRIGALIGKASPTDVEQLGIFGKKLGIAFQLRDDLLDVYADQSQFGKQVGGDILSNKKTYLLLKALEQAQGDDLTTLSHWLTLTDFVAEEKVNAVKEIYNKLNIKSQCETLIEKYTQEALAALEAISIDSSKKAPLLDISNKLLLRSV